MPGDFPDRQGSFSYENWKAYQAGVPAREALEYPLYSDATITGELLLGPHHFLNCIARPTVEPARPVLVVRVEYHVEWSYGEMARTDDSQYHGGSVQDELAALLSLCLGTRLKAGGANRWFKRGDDPRGRPWSFRESGRADPIPVPPGDMGPVIPRCSKERHIDPSLPMTGFLLLAPDDSVALLRAARLYQDGLWLADSQPALAWLLLVSALEAAANHWRPGREDPRATLKWAIPELDSYLQEQGGDSHADRVADMLADRIGSTKKFVEFCLNFLPSAPEDRPPEHLQIEWDPRFLRRALGCIYTYRSKALHAGKPFPAPMCWPPNLCADPLAEKLPGGAAGGFGGIWRSRHIPMLLHVFEHLTRGVLLSWWESLAPIRTSYSGPSGAP